MLKEVVTLGLTFQYNALQADLTTMVQRKRSRWEVETIFRDTKQLAALGACQCWVDQAKVRRGRALARQTETLHLAI